MSKITLDTLIHDTNKALVELEHRNCIHTTMRMDECIAFVKKTYVSLRTIKGDLKFNLAFSGEHCTITCKVNGKETTAGTDKISAGDEVVFTIVVAEGYNLGSAKVNGVDYVSGTVIDVVDDITLTVVTYQIEET